MIAKLGVVGLLDLNLGFDVRVLVSLLNNPQQPIPDILDLFAPVTSEIDLSLNLVFENSDFYRSYAWYLVPISTPPSLCLLHKVTYTLLPTTTKLILTVSVNE